MEARVRAELHPSGESSSPTTVECRTGRCRVTIPDSEPFEGELESELRLEGCARSDLVAPRGVRSFLYACWDDGRSDWPARMERTIRSRIDGWAGRRAARISIRSLECRDCGCRLVLGFPDERAAREVEREDAPGYVTAFRHCEGTTSGLSPARDGNGLVRTVTAECTGEDGWSMVETPEEHASQRERQLARFREEPRDAAWAEPTERAISAALAESQAAAMPALVAVECARARCRVDLGPSRLRGRRPDPIRTALQFEGCRVEPLEAEDDGTQSLAVDCAWPQGARGDRPPAPTEAQIRRRYEEAAEALRGTTRFGQVECRTSECIVDVVDSEGEPDLGLFRSFGDVAGCRAHARSGDFIYIGCER